MSEEVSQSPFKDWYIVYLHPDSDCILPSVRALVRSKHELEAMKITFGNRILEIEEYERNDAIT